MYNRCKIFCRIGSCLLFLLFLFTTISWKVVQTDELKWIQRILSGSYNQAADTGLKKWDLSVTFDGFFRLRKHFASGKQEYFSFNFKRLSDIDFEGTLNSGNILFTTSEDDIIVQTYNDPKGNIDSMTSVLSLPVINVKPEQIDSLKSTVSMFKH
jgi:hypothetical protein